MKRFLTVLLLAALGAAVFYDGTQWRMRRAERFFTAGDYPAALSIWSSLARSPLTGDEALYNSGAAAYRMGNYSAAAGYFRAVYATDGRGLNWMALYNLGTTDIRLAEQGTANGETERHLEAAVTHLERAQSLHPGEGSVLANLQSARMRLAAIRRGTGGMKGDASRDATAQQRAPEADTGKRTGQREPAKDGAHPGKATGMDSEGARKRPAAMDRNQAFRLLDEARGRESLRSATPVSVDGKSLSPPEKDW
ncbi:MAG: hypothetical protein HZC44_03000 [Geobacter sp.]|nr:hypothetical protein [Geobacter sp.]